LFPVDAACCEIMSAPSVFTEAAPARVETSCRSVMPAGGTTEPAPLLPKNPITTSPSIPFFRAGARIQRVLRAKRPDEPVIGAALSTSA
jgi:hypothetical protein